MLPAIRRVVGNTKCTVELWSWRSSLARGLKDFSMSSQKFSIELFDEKSSQVTFKELKYDPSIPLSARDHCFVLIMATSTTIDDMETLIVERTRWPALFNFIDDKTVQVVFRDYSKHSFDSSSLKKTVLRSSSVSSVQTYLEYTNNPMEMWDSSDSS